MGLVLTRANVDDTLSPEPQQEASSFSEPHVIAEVYPDGDTTIRFEVDDANDHEAPVDVVIIGRDGGFDYGGVLQAGSTPLELFHAIEGVDTTAPVQLEVAHGRYVDRYRVDKPELDPPHLPTIGNPPNNGVEDDTGLSTYTCKSWSKFNNMLSNRLAGNGQRSQKSDFQAGTALHILYSPNGNNTWAPGRADATVCNYDSVGNHTSDQFLARICHYNALQPGANHVCGFTQVEDSYYYRRIYGFAFNSRRYWAEATNKNTSLMSYLGIARSN